MLSRVSRLAFLNAAALKHVKSYKYEPHFLAGELTHVDEVAIKLVFDPNKR